MKDRRKRAVSVVALAIITFLVLGVAYISLVGNKFRASAEILITNTTLQMSGPDAVLMPTLVDNGLMQSQIELLTSDRILMKAVDDLGPEFVKSPVLESQVAAHRSPWMGRLATAASELINGLGSGSVQGSRSPRMEEPSQAANSKHLAIQRLRSEIGVARVGASQILRVTGLASDAKEAARIANAVISAYIKDQAETNSVVTTSAALRERIKVIGPIARVIREALPPVKHGPGVSMILGLSIAGGLFTGLGLVVGSAFLDRGIRSPEHITALTSRECLGFIPIIKPEGSRLLHAHTPSPAALPDDLSINLSSWVISYPLSVFAQTLKRVWFAALEQQPRGPRTLGVVSCFAGEGTTTVAANIAQLIASEGYRVLLVDAAIHNPQLSRILAPDGSGGVGLSVSREISLKHAAEPSDLAGLDLLCLKDGGAATSLVWLHHHPELLSSSLDYDWIIFDLPPLATAPDARSAATFLANIVLVVEWGRTSGALEEILSTAGAAREKLIGAMINKVPEQFLRDPKFIT